MNGGILTGNKTSGSGGGVRVDSGKFTMNGGTISGNTASSGGGVYVGLSTFTMAGGIINGNASQDKGGGVYVGGGNRKRYFTDYICRRKCISYTVTYVHGEFIKPATGGIISGSNSVEEQANKAKDDDSGHAVYVQEIQERNVEGKKRNATIRATTMMDIRKNGPAGGWE